MMDANVMQPDLTLVLDEAGVIRGARSSNDIAGESLDDWVDRPWADTVADLGRDKVDRLVDDARCHGVAAFRQLNQRFPSGLELLVEYTVVRGEREGTLIAVGKSLQAVSELQSRLVAAQQAMERDYWKLREVETRYRLLFSASREAVLLVGAGDLQIIEANPAGAEALGLPSRRREDASGVDLLEQVDASDRAAVQTMLLRAREHGSAPAIRVRIGGDPRYVRASLLAVEGAAVFMIQIAPAAEMGGWGVPDDLPLRTLMDRAPDAFVVLDRQGRIEHANRTFVGLVEVGAEGGVLGQPLSRWLGRPGVDTRTLLDNVRRHGAVRLLATTLHGELGGRTEVELSAIGDQDGDAVHYGVILRDVGRRLPAETAPGPLGADLSRLEEQIGHKSLRDLVRETVAVLERHYIEAALEVSGGNRTAAAEVLGLSRQSLHAKLNRYDLDGSRTLGHDPAPRTVAAAKAREEEAKREIPDEDG